MQSVARNVKAGHVVVISLFYEVAVREHSFARNFLALDTPASSEEEQKTMVFVLTSKIASTRRAP
jgi:hypothetical protein